MSIHKTYAVLGLGRYGRAVAKELTDSGAEVLAVDTNQNIVNQAALELPYCKCANITDPEVFYQLGIGDVDTVIIAMASNLEATVMAITLCKEAGVQNVIVKSGNETQSKIYTRLGADKVVFPEKESGVRLAKNLLSSGFVDMIELSQDVSMVDLDVQADWVGKNLIQLNLRRKYGINIVAVRNAGVVQTDVNPETPLTAEMKLIVIADTKKLNKLNK
ncbi:MAG: TrkA family potassium uptake protein [Oscillospiraceae bacterium]|nr:TrkA family potassium uptake protein [Oscillospiraceae bacterium]